ncbi:hypothetical protein [Dechloromonas sp. A34]|uniref:hypothetical protein n=1 Tax=Dechloromonas sp. A34 TaxID=447588 RepID=UPI002248A7B5|nr:hypothetical protein [Dechloromonas sp. A34]
MDRLEKGQQASKQKKILDRKHHLPPEKRKSEAPWRLRQSMMVSNNHADDVVSVAWILLGATGFAPP